MTVIGTAFKLPEGGRIGLFAAKQPDFSKSFTLSESAKTVLTSRGLDDTEQTALSGIYTSGRDQVEQGTALDYVRSLDSQSLALLQEATWSGNAIDVNALSEEQAENLLLQPGEGIDTDNDGTVSTVDVAFRQFPPLNAPDSVKAAWTAAFQATQEKENPTAGVPSDVFDWLGHGTDADYAGPNFASPDFDWTAFAQQGQSASETAGSDTGTDTDTNTETSKPASFLDRFLAALLSAGFSTTTSSAA